ncbi:Cloroperoxidase, partial [Fistulina hepatica ATCC 64428]
LQSVVFFCWDVLQTAANVILPQKKHGHVLERTIVCVGQEGTWPSTRGEWPPYVAPKEGDSRCSCPALNAMANHGILPHDGKNISFAELSDKIHATYNISTSFCWFVPNFAARMLGRNYTTDRLDLADLDLHNGVEHDASLTREDAALQPIQGPPCLPLVESLLASASGTTSSTTRKKTAEAENNAADVDAERVLTINDIALFSAKRRLAAKATNPDYSLSFNHKLFGASNSGLLLCIFGGRVEDLRPFLVEERLRDGWEPVNHSRKGMTMSTLN